MEPHAEDMCPGEAPEEAQDLFDRFCARAGEVHDLMCPVMAGVGALLREYAQTIPDKGALSEAAARALHDALVNFLTANVGGCELQGPVELNVRHGAKDTRVEVNIPCPLGIAGAMSISEVRREYHEPPEIHGGSWSCSEN